MLILLFSLLLLHTLCVDWTQVDKVVQEAIENRAFPGGVLSVGNLNQTLYTKAYGTLTYQHDIH